MSASQAFVQPVHVAVRGRARFKVSGLYRSVILKTDLETSLAGRNGVRAVSANVRTGRVLVFFDTGNGPGEIVALLQAVVIDHRKKCGEADGGVFLASEGKGNNARKVVRRKGDVRAASKSIRQVRQLVSRAEPQEEKPWHLLKAKEVLAFLGTERAQGLSEQAHQACLRRYGPNLLSEAVPRSWLGIFVGQFKSLPVVFLGISACVSALTGGVADAIAIMAVVLINAVIGAMTESTSERTIYSLKTLVRPTALMLRGKKMLTVGTETVVPGDLLVLRPGSYVGADARLVEAEHLSVDESALTGESVPVVKSTGQLRSAQLIPLPDRVNMVYMGTLVTGGQGVAVVVATGAYTEIGRIQALASETERPETPLETQLDRLGRQLVFISLGACAVVFVIGLARGYGLLQMAKTAISLAVAAVPEGLPAVATTTLALGIRNMRRRHVLVRRLEAVETIGSIQTICLDKTGTLTLNRMCAKVVYVGLNLLEVHHEGFLGPGGRVDPYSCEELLRLLHVTVLCNESGVFARNGGYEVKGSSTENALIHMAIAAGINVPSLRKTFRLVRIVYRSEGQNIMFTLHRKPTDEEGMLIALKGSPDEVLSSCSWYLKDGARHALGEDERAEIAAANERMAARGLRILGVAYALLPDGVGRIRSDSLPSEELVWLGMVGLEDPVREGAAELIRAFHQAGIDTVMITGDQTPTAHAIGRQLALSRGEQLEILDSTQLAQLPPDALRALCERVQVFSRVSPAHKLHIVQALQRTGRVVAMTGDGINDGPALKAASIGIAMGHTGTDVAREVADIVLEDDNLQTMLMAVSQGRSIYQNIRKSLHFILSTNMTEIMVTIGNVALGVGQPLTTIQLLWINLMSDVFPCIALALEQPEPDVLSVPPRDPSEPILTRAMYPKMVREAMVMSAGALAAYGYGVSRYGRGPQATGLEFLSLVCGQLLHALSCRSERHSLFDRTTLPPNRYLSGALCGSFLLQGLALVVPGMRSFLGIAPLSVMDAMVVGGTSLLGLMVNESAKMPMRRKAA